MTDVELAVVAYTLAQSYRTTLYRNYVLKEMDKEEKDARKGFSYSTTCVLRVFLAYLVFNSCPCKRGDRQRGSLAATLKLFLSLYFILFHCNSFYTTN